MDASVDECDPRKLQGDEKAWGQGSRELLLPLLQVKNQHKPTNLLLNFFFSLAL